MNSDPSLEKIVFDLVEIVEKMLTQIENLKKEVRLLNER